MKYRFLIILSVVMAMVSCDIFNNDPDKPSGKKDKDTEADDQHRDLMYLFDQKSVPEVTVTLTEEQWNQYLNNFDSNEDNALYVTASFTFRKDGKTYQRDSIGLRPRGNTSRVRPESSRGEKHQDGAPWHHAHFGVKFTEYETGERFFGCDRMILKWVKEDPAYCREIFCYDLFHRFGVWSAPYASYCRLSFYIEGDKKPVYMGVYLMVENPRKGWMNDRMKQGYIPDKSGNLWKGNYGANLSEANKSKMGIADDYGKSYVYNLKTNKDKLAAAQNELASFISEMTPLPSGSSQLKEYLEKHVDIDLFLRATAVNVMVGMWDDYWCNQNNYYFYFDSNHRFYFIPFDYDNTLGTGKSEFGNPGTQNPMKWGSLNGDRILMRKVMSISEYQETYKKYLRQIAAEDSLMSYAGATARLRQYQDLVRNYIDNDTHEDCTIEDRGASWSAFWGYRLFSGEAGNGLSESNYFKTKAKTVANIQ